MAGCWNRKARPRWPTVPRAACIFQLRGWLSCRQGISMWCQPMHLCCMRLPISMSLSCSQGLRRSHAPAWQSLPALLGRGAVPGLQSQPQHRPPPSSYVCCRPASRSPCSSEKRPYCSKTCSQGGLAEAPVAWVDSRPWAPGQEQARGVSCSCSAQSLEGHPGTQERAA